MKILHYSLGLPPYRTGGLTKYVTDLMLEQVRLNNEVSILWPGRINVFSKKTKIIKNKDYKNIHSFELINPIPVPLLNGIKDTDMYLKSLNKELFEKFIEALKPDIVHFHTVMGISKELFEILKEKKIKMVYTTHDYFGLCPKVNFFYNNNRCNGKECINCAKCNESALSFNKIMILQSNLYRKMKNTTGIKKLRAIFKKKNKKIENRTEYTEAKNDNAIDTAKKYNILRKYYLEIFSYIDEFHFNSNIAKSVFKKYIKIRNYKVIPIIHSDISDNRTIKEFQLDNLKITYLGPTDIKKGYMLLKEVLDKLYANGYKNIKLKIFDETDNLSSYIKMNPRYDYGDLKKIFDETDLIVVPSLWNETFGFNVIEGISYGVPVLTSAWVGANDILNYKDILKPFNTKAELYRTLEKVYMNRKILKEVNLKIMEYENKYFKFSNHVKEIIEKIYM